MSTALPARPRHTLQSKSHITIVASIYNTEYTNALLENAKDELSAILPHAKLDIARVPGAFEIPVACEKVLCSEASPDAIIALGVIIQGQTKHAELVADSVTQALQTMAVEHKKPVIHEVLLIENLEQAHARCIGEELNRGREAARSAHTMIELFQAMDRPKPKKPMGFTTKK